MSTFINVFANVFEAPFQRVREVTKGFLLRQNGGALLLQNGGLILL